MPKHVIVSEIPNAGDLSPEDLKGVSQKSCSVLQELGPQVHWVHKYRSESNPPKLNFLSLDL